MTSPNPQDVTDSLVIAEYSDEWPHWYSLIYSYLWPAVREWSTAIEHVGSTSVAGLAARPIIDVDIFVKDDELHDYQIKIVESLGYSYHGERGFYGRHALSQNNSLPSHNLYLCIRGHSATENHLFFRDYLRDNPEKVAEYSRIKKDLVAAHKHDVQTYLRNKTEFISECLHKAAMDEMLIQEIVSINLARTGNGFI